MLGRIALGRGEHARARAALSGALALSRAMQNTDATINALTSLGQVALRDGKPEEAEARYGEALALAGDRWYNRQMIAGTRTRLAEVALARGDLAAAAAHARASLAEWRSATNPTVLAEALEALATVATKDGDGARALRLAGAAAAQRATTGSARQADDPARLGNVLQQAREGLGDAAVGCGLGRGPGQPALEQAVVTALEGDRGEGSRPHRHGDTGTATRRSTTHAIGTRELGACPPLPDRPAPAPPSTAPHPGGGRPAPSPSVASTGPRLRHAAAGCAVASR